ncbi:outer membrane beta-barrel protein [Riemerella anatipestifer]
MKKIGLAALFLGLAFANAQNLAREITYGAFVGGIYSKMGNIEPAIIPEGIYQGYQTQEKAETSVMAGLFLNWKYPTERISIQPELFYTRQKTDFTYTDVKGLNYTIAFGYNNLNAGFLFKYYLTDKLYIGAGPYLTLNLDKDALVYTSNGSEMSTKTGVYFEPDAVVQSTLKQSFEGKDYFHTAFALGYEFENGLGIGARYQLGLSDALETQENGHRFKNTNNRVNAISLQISYRFNFDSFNNF